MEGTDYKECSSLAEGLWDKLQKDLQLEILGRLPVESIYKFSCVCNEWNALLSNKFIRDIWAKTPVNKEPWLIVCDVFSTAPCMAYCFYRRTWKHCFSISREPIRFEVFLCGSATGLLLLDKLPRGGGCRTYVYNPYSRACIKLPRMLFIKDIHVAKGIGQSGNDCNNNQENCYKVAAVGTAMFNDGKGSVVEIYESCTKSWRATRLASEFVINHDLVFLDGTFYCLVMQPMERVMAILGFSISAPSAVPSVFFVPLPKLLSNSHMGRLIICGPRILVAACIAFQDVVTITIWELEIDHRLGSSSWKEITRMPPSLYQEDFTGPLVCFECVGVGETWACFKSVFGKPTSGWVFAYNTCNKSWSRLPQCPTRQWNRQSLLAFEPRPCMNVG